MPLLATEFEKDNYINEITSRMSYADIRKKGRVDISGIVAVVNYFAKRGINFDISKSAHKIPSVLEEFSITDIYYKGHRIDVITILQDGIAAIPKKHFEYSIAPDFYYVIKLESDLQTFETIGCLKPEDVLNSKSDSNFYYPEAFFPEKELIEIIKNPNVSRDVIGNHKDCKSLFIRFLDNELSYSYKRSFIRHIMSCPLCLRELSYFNDFNDASKLITDYPELTGQYYKKATGQLSCNDSSDKTRVSSKIKNVFKNTKDIIKEIFSKTQKQKNNKNFLNEIPQDEDECIDLIFNHEIQKEKFNISNVFKRKKAKMLFIIPLLILSLVVFGIIKASSGNNERELPQEEFVDQDFEQTPSLENEFSQTWNNEIQEPAEITQVTNQVNKVSWEIPKKLSKNDTYIKFLQITGKNIQINLQNDLLVVRSAPVNRSVKVNVFFKNYGSIVSLKTIKSSGNDEIDNIIEKNIFNAFSYVRPPKTDLKNVDLTLSIEL